jgi:hypothetical protein
VNETGIVLYALCVPATIVGMKLLLVAAREGIWEEFMGYTEL